MATITKRQKYIFAGPIETKTLKVGSSVVVDGIQDGTTSSTSLTTCSWVKEEILSRIGNATEFKGALNSLAQITALTTADLTAGDTYVIGTNITLTANPTDTPIHNNGALITDTSFVLYENSKLVWDGENNNFDYVTSELNQGAGAGQSPVNAAALTASSVMLTDTNSCITTQTTLPIANGGTNAATAADARTNLGLGSAAQCNTGNTDGDLPELGAALGASQVVETNAASELISAAKGTAYNKSFGTGTANVPEIGATLGNSMLVKTDAAGKLITAADKLESIADVDFDSTDANRADGTLIAWDTTNDRWEECTLGSLQGSIQDLSFESIALDTAANICVGASTYSAGTGINCVVSACLDISRIISVSIYDTTSTENRHVVNIEGAQLTTFTIDEGLATEASYYALEFDDLYEAIPTTSGYVMDVIYRNGGSDPNN